MMKRKKKRTPKMLQSSKEPKNTICQINGNVILHQIRELEKEHRMKI